VVKGGVRALSFAAVLRLVAVLATLAFASAGHAHPGYRAAPRAPGDLARHLVAKSSATPSAQHSLSHAPACPGETSGACSCGVALGSAPHPLPACIAARRGEAPPFTELTRIRHNPVDRHDTSLIVAATYAARAPPPFLP
jgi:hypothetical protein